MRQLGYYLIAVFLALIGYLLSQGITEIHHEQHRRPFWRSLLQNRVATGWAVTFLLFMSQHEKYLRRRLSRSDLSKKTAV